MSRLTIVLLATVVLLGATIGILTHQILQAPRSIKLSSRPHSSNIPSLQSQRMCADQAEHVFTSEGWRLDGSQQNGMIATYTDHFNVRLNKCFMLLAVTNVNETTKDISNSYALTDAFEGTTYAAYYGTSSQGNALPSITQCEISDPNSPRVVCHSSEEWKRLVTPYIESGAMQ